MHCRSFNFKEPTSPPLHWSCAPKKLEQPSSSLACTPHTISQLQKACVATRLSSNAVMYVWWISSDPLKYALESLRSEVPGIQKSILNRELRKLKNWKCSAFSSPFLPILARFSSTSRERSVSKDSGIWLTDFVLSLSLFFTECQMTTEAIQTPRTADVSKWDLLFTGNCLSLLSHHWYWSQEGKNKTITARWQGVFPSEADSGLTFPPVENMTASWEFPFN